MAVIETKAFVIGCIAVAAMQYARGAEIEQGRVSAIALYNICTPSDSSCTRHEEAVRNSKERDGLAIEAHPIFRTEGAVEWNDCSRAGAPAVCLHLQDDDVDRWNSEIGKAPRKGVAIVVGDTIIGVVGIRGAFANPLAIQQMDGAVSPVELKAFLRRESQP